MKKIMIMMVVLGSVAFGRDFENRERQELEYVMNYFEKSNKMSPREVDLSLFNVEKYSGYHNELENMNRGNEKK